MSTELRRGRTAFLSGCVVLVVGAALAVFATVDKAAPLPVGTVPIALLLVVIGVLAAVYGKRAEWAEKKAKAEREWRTAIGPLLRQWPPPLVRSAADVDFGATRTRHTDDVNAYVPRAADRPLRYALGARKFVLLRGESKAGKSRTLAEAVRHAHPEAELVLPRDAKAVAELSRLEPALPLGNSVVVVLDDLSSADLDQLTTSVLDFWAERAVLVGTITASRYEAVMRTGSDVGAAARVALARATVVDLPFELSEGELAAAHEDYPEESGLVERSSIGEVLVGGEELVRKLRSGRRDSPAGQAVVRAAVDVRRAGLRRAVSPVELTHLFPKYLERITVGVDPTAELFAAGLAWACAPIASQVALLRRVSGGLEVLDYVVEAEAGAEMPDFLGADLLAITSAADAYGIGDAAYAAGRSDLARQGFRRAMEDPGSLAAAAFSLGVVLAGQDDAAGAERVYRQAIETGHPVFAYLAMVNLGFLLLERDAVEEAREVFRTAADTRPVERGPRARVGLGEVLLREERFDEAEAAFRQVLDVDDPATVPLGLHGLGRALAAQGNDAAAREVYLRAATCDHPKISTWAKKALDP
ncbi:tetratricopeptide repeat protein [Umezawaea sp. Da 62-37]|uniref:tetratricopeptide repeat protein n=1 Tax=Umezawaea sp. Da 62-37 TaxID=3075927 RepID=UPI0028F6D378|nr:tetratricopeptide repeat protein [Umezawaea sp. Da 62-37]WNV90710.1 tetratricopeptide repeat protein [Umezawaea sp. Da 62-37]